MELKPSYPKARRSTPTLEMRNNYYVVPMDGLFHYFNVKVDAEDLADPSKKFVRIIKSPPVLVDGVIISNRQAFAVSANDILRGRINKSNKFQIERGEDEPSRDTDTTNETSATGTGSTTVRGDRYQFEAVRDTPLEIREAADKAWEDQVGALFTDIPPEEGGEWVIEANPQS